MLLKHARWWEHEPVRVKKPAMASWEMCSCCNKRSIIFKKNSVIKLNFVNYVLGNKKKLTSALLPNLSII